MAAVRKKGYLDMFRMAGQKKGNCSHMCEQ